MRIHIHFARLANILPFIGALLAAAIPAHAGGKDMQAFRMGASEWLSQRVEHTFPDTLSQVQMGQVDSRLRLGPCNEVSYFLPPGARLWSTGSLGMKCVSPSRWTLYLTYQIQLTGPALEATRPLASRQLLTPADVTLANVPYAQDPGSYLREIPSVATTQRPISARQPRLVHDLVLPDVIRAGANVRVRVQGGGFSVSQEGKDRKSAKAGGAVQVKMPGGRIVRGLATPMGDVEIR